MWDHRVKGAGRGVRGREWAEPEIGLVGVGRVGDMGGVEDSEVGNLKDGGERDHALVRRLRCVGDAREVDAEGGKEGEGEALDLLGVGVDDDADVASTLDVLPGTSDCDDGETGGRGRSRGEVAD